MDCKFEVKEGKMYITTDDYWYVIDTVTHSCTAISVDEVIAAQEKKVEEDEQYNKQELDRLLLKYVHGKEETKPTDDELPF